MIPRMILWWKRHSARKQMLEIARTMQQIETLLAEYFEIDLKKVEQERRAILESIRRKRS